MQQRWSWLKSIFRPGKSGMLALLTPTSVQKQNLVVRLCLAGGTIAGMGIAAAIGAVACAWLMLAVSVIYFLSTQVLGLKLNFDPRAFYEHVQRQAATAYGPN